MHRYPPTAWGGRIGRYAKHRRAVGRCFDPFDGKDVVFPHERDYEAWIRQRFSPATLRISHAPVSVQARIDEREVRAEATFEVTDRLGNKHYHLVCGPYSSKSAASRLRIVAKHHDAQVVITELSELRQDTALFWRLELLRQACELYDGEGSGLDAKLVCAAQSGACNRSSMHRRFPQVACQLIDARLGHLQHSARLRLLLDRDDYGILAVEGGAA
jgi:hypothetical protein